jgi:hypothetical protein
LDYLYGTLLSLGTLIFLLVPYFKSRLLREGSESAEE